MALDVIVISCFAANMAFWPLSFLGGIPLLTSIDVLNLISLSSLFALAVGRLMPLRAVSAIRSKKTALHACSLALLSLPTAQGIICLLGFRGPTEPFLLFGVLSELAGLLLYGLVLPASSEEGKSGAASCLAAFVVAVCATYGLAAGVDAFDPSSVSISSIVFRVLCAGCMGVFFRERKSEQINLLLAAGAIVGVQLALTLGACSDAIMTLLSVLMLICLALPSLWGVAPRAKSRSVPEEPQLLSGHNALDHLGLSEGERKAVELTMAGMTSSEAAVQMGVKAPTVRSYLQRAYKKAGVTSFGELKKQLPSDSRSVVDEAKEETEGTAEFRTAFSPLLIGLVYLLPLSGLGLPVASLYAWVPVGIFIWSALDQINLKIVAILGLISSTLIGASFVAISVDQAMGWTAGLSTTIGLSSATLTLCITSACTRCCGERPTDAMAGASCQMALLIPCIALLLVSGYSTVTRGILVCLSGIGLFLPLVLRSQRSASSIPGGRIGNPLDFLAALYLGAVACDANMSHCLFFSRLFAMLILFLIVVAQTVELLKCTSFSGKKRVVLLAAIVCFTALASEDGCIAILTSAILLNVLSICVPIDNAPINRRALLGVALGIVLALCAERLDYASPAATDFVLRTAMGKTVVRTLVFDAGSVLVGIVLLADSLSKGKVIKNEEPAGSRALQYLQARGLTDLEARIVLATVQGESPTAIAHSQNCTLGTINSARHKAYHLLGVHSKGELTSLLEEHLRTSFKV